MSQQQHGTGAAAENRLLDATTVTKQLQQREDLRVVRRQCKGAVTRFLRILERAIIEWNEAKVQDGLVKLKACFSRFELAHDNYHDTLDTDESIDASELWFHYVALNYMEGIQSAMDFLARCSQPPNDNAISTDISKTEASASSATAPAGDIVTDKLMTLLNIPRAELDVFSGDPSEYHTFMSVFDENIDSKIDDLQIKLTRLIQYTKGAAKAAIRNCILIGGADGYSKARGILRKRFGNDYLVSESIINDLKHGKRLTIREQ